MVTFSRKDTFCLQLLSDILEANKEKIIMKKSEKIRISLLGLMSILVSCSTNPVDKFQGVYIADKDSLRVLLQKDMDDDNAFAVNLLNIAIENAVIEFEIKGDSINGLMFLAGESTTINSKIVTRNDGMIIKVGEVEANLTPTPTGLLFGRSNSDLSIHLIKSERTKLSEETWQAIKEEKEYEKSLGKWQLRNFVDDFGDSTSSKYIKTQVEGTFSNSATSNSYLFAEVLFTKSAIGIFFHEYNISSPNARFIEDDYILATVNLKNSKGETLFLGSSLEWGDDGGISFRRKSNDPDDDYTKFKNFIQNNTGKIKVVVKDRFGSSYLFSIDSTGFTEGLALL